VIEKTRTHADPYLYPNVDWMDEILRDYSHNRSANVNVSGGSDKAVYYIGLAYYDEDGMYKDTKLSDYNSNTYYRRYNVTTNLTLNPFRTTEIKLGIQGYLANANYPASAQSTIFESAYFTQPTYIAPLYPDGKLGAFSGGELNPVAELGATGYANQWRSQVYSNLRITQQLYKGLSITGMFSFDTYNYTSNRFTKSPNTYHATGRDANGNLIYEQTRQGTENLAYSLSAKGDRTIYLEAALNYKNTFGRHDVSGMLLFNQSDEINTKATNVEEALPYRFRGLAGRFTYGFDDRYFAEFNFGYNGSENFTPKNRYGFFPSVGLGWVISNESFFEPLTNVIQYLKVRGTWGQVGNSQISGRRFAYLATVTDSSSTSYTFGKNMDQNYGTTAIDEYAVDVTWEVADKTDIGVDMRLLNNKLNLQFDYFKESREGIYLRRSSIPSYVGMINNPYGNIGKVENKGFELSVNYANSWGGDWSLSLMGNYSFNRNKVLEDDSTVVYPWQNTIGNKVGQRFGLVALGLFESYGEIAASPVQTGDTRPGDIKYKDINGDEDRRIRQGTHRLGQRTRDHVRLRLLVGLEEPLAHGHVPGCRPCGRHAQRRRRAALLAGVEPRQPAEQHHRPLDRGESPPECLLSPSLDRKHQHELRRKHLVAQRYRLPAPEEHRTLLPAARPLDETDSSGQCPHLHTGRKPSHVQLVQDLGRGTRRRTRRPLSEHRLRQSGRKLQFLNTDQP